MRAAILSLACVVLVAIGLPAMAQSAPNLDALRALAHKHARVSALVVDITHGQVIAQYNPQQRLTPASVTKLYTTAAALQRWGPDHRFTTRLASRGTIRHGLLDGDLVLVGAGDPDFDTDRLWSLVTRLRQAGVREVSGDLIINDSRFGSVACLTRDRCDARSASDNSYDAPLSAAGVNFSTVELSILPAAQVGESARLVLRPPGLQGFDIEGDIDTVAAGKPARYAVHRSTDHGEHTLTVSGGVPIDGGPYRVTRAVAYPSRYTASVAAAVLARAGITLQGGLRVSSQPLTGALHTVAAVDSRPLVAQLHDMLAYSNNYMADTLTLDLLADAGAAPPLTLPLAAQQLETLAATANNTQMAWRAGSLHSKPPLVIDTGSGLSPSNRISAADLVSLLTWMYRQNGLFGSFVGSMPVPRYTPSHMLKRGNAAWLNRLAAKTGTLTEPVSVRSLAGYLRLRGGGWGAFAIIVNGSRRRGYIPGRTSLDAIRADLEAILTQY